jgi:hypothetical protein
VNRLLPYSFRRIDVASGYGEGCLKQTVPYLAAILISLVASASRSGYMAVQGSTWGCLAVGLKILGLMSAYPKRVGSSQAVIETAFCRQL